MTTYHELLDNATRELDRAGSSSPRLDAEVLLRLLSGLDRTQLFLRLPEAVPSDLIAPYRQALARRASGEPVAYITGEREFMGMTFRVTPDVLVPRPETELLVEWALEQVKASGSAMTVVDAGTGSGAIAVSVAALASEPIDVIGTDISERASAVASGNADALLAAERRERVAFRTGSLLQPVDGPVDLVVANLPYLTPNQIGGNPDLDAEPRMALDGGSDGLDLIRELVADVPRMLAPDGCVGLEIDPGQERKVRAMLRTLFPGRVVRTIRDLAGLARHVVVEVE